MLFFYHRKFKLQEVNQLYKNEQSDQTLDFSYCFVQFSFQNVTILATNIPKFSAHAYIFGRSHFRAEGKVYCLLQSDWLLLGDCDKNVGCGWM